MKNFVTLSVIALLSFAVAPAAQAFGVKTVLTCTEKFGGGDKGFIVKILANPEKGLVADLSRETISGTSSVGQWAVENKGTNVDPNYVNEDLNNPFSLKTLPGEFTRLGHRAQLQFGLAAAIYTVYCK